MMQRVYAIRDLKSGFYPPSIQKNDEVAMRNFAFSVSNNDVIIGFNPSDFDFYYLGDFDEERGIFVQNDLPKLIMNGSECVK